MKDPRGNPVGTRVEAALTAAERAMWRMMSFYGAPLDDLAAAQAADPGWGLPVLMQAGFLLSLTEPALLGQSAALLERAAPLVARADPREQAHLAALQRLQAGDWPGALDTWEALLLARPRDALALQWAHLFDFHRGDAFNLRQRVARVLPEWDAGDPLHPYVLGLHAFGLEESQLYAQAEETGRRALDGGAKVPWAIHAVAHVMEMQGRFTDGEAWMARWSPDWTVGNGFVGHLGWHQALFALEALDAGSALRRFDQFLAADPEQITLQRLDASSLLWRLKLLDIDVGPRWRALVDGWTADPASAGDYPFNDIHRIVALVGGGELGAAREWAAAAERNSAGASTRLAPNDDTIDNRRLDVLGPRAVTRDVAVPLMHGLLAFAEGRFDAAISALYSLRALTHRIGGSHAQRDLLDQTILAAAVGARDSTAGRALLNERRLAKPETPLTAHWAARLA